MCDNMHKHTDAHIRKDAHSHARIEITVLAAKIRVKVFRSITCSSMRKNRLKQGKPFDEFVAGWLKKRPNEEIIQNYGNYPEPRVENYDKPFWGMYE